MKETHSYCACFRLFSCDPGPPTETFAELICFLGKPSLLVRDGGIPGLLMAKLPAGFLAANQGQQQRLFYELPPSPQPVSSSDRDIDCVLLVKPPLAAASSQVVYSI